MTETEARAKVLDLLEDVTGEPEELGFLDSMAAIELLVGLEDELGVSIAPTEVERSEMNTANKIVAQVVARL